MALERLFFEPETPASDVYSLAATLFESLPSSSESRVGGRRHAAYIVDRLSFLRLLGIGGAGTELEQLIGSGLAFNHEERPPRRSSTSGHAPLLGWSTPKTSRLGGAVGGQDGSGGGCSTDHRRPLTGQTLRKTRERLARPLHRRLPVGRARRYSSAGAWRRWKIPGRSFPVRNRGAGALHGRKVPSRRRSRLG